MKSLADTDRPIYSDSWSRRMYRKLHDQRRKLLCAFALPVSDARAGGDLVDEADLENQAFYESNVMAWRSLVQIDRALDNLAEGTYGLCENCGEAIAKARLAALPFASLCRTCKQEEELSEGGRTRIAPSTTPIAHRALTGAVHSGKPDRRSNPRKKDRVDLQRNSIHQENMERSASDENTRQSSSERPQAQTRVGKKQE